MPNNLQTSSTSTSPTILTDDPQWSSAALCISLQLLTTNFGPEYTHQCVEGETFRGYQPFKDSLVKAAEKYKSTTASASNIEQIDLEKTILHKSHRGHTSTSQELAIQVELAPSCRKCKVSIETSNASGGSTSDDQIAKKPRLESEGKQESTTTASASDATTSAGSGLDNSPMTETEIQESIATALPEIVDIPCSDDYLERPAGSILEEYKVSTREGCSNDYCLALADGVDAKDYHCQVQKLALWFIENADDVDVSNQDSGFWKVLYLFQKHPNGYSLVGYATLFHFMAPFHKPNPGIIVRICQALVLPPYQGQGHGRRLIQTVYDIMHGSHQQAYGGALSKAPLVLVNVEDPAPAFVALRNKLDLKLMTDHTDWWPKGANNNDRVTDENFFVALSEAEASTVGGLAKITSRQVHLVREMSKLVVLKEYAGEDKEALTTKFRLMVKKRLNKEHAEEMSTYSTKERKKAYLAELYDAEMQLYESLLRSRR